MEEKRMLNIGCHLSAASGYRAMGEEAVKIGANVFQFFTRNPRGGKGKGFVPEDAEALLRIAEKNKFVTMIAHAPYTLNPCSADKKIREFTKMVIAEDLERMEFFPNNFYNFHPGNHLQQGVTAGIQYIVEMLNAVLKPEQTTTVLLETMAGKGTEIGKTFEELRQILDGVALSDKVGVCLDTCHVYDAGYDIVNDLDGVLEEFDRIIGLDRLCLIHLNDSKNAIGSRKDRHAKIGEGLIGKEAIIRLINHPKLCRLPFCLETPNDLAGYEEEIKMLRAAYRGGCK